MGWLIFVLALVLVCVIYLVITLLVAKSLGLVPTQVSIGLFWLPIRLKLDATEWQFGPLPFGSSIGFSGSDGDATVAYQSAHPLVRGMLAVCGFVLMILVGWVLLSGLVQGVMLDALRGYFTLPFSFAVPFNFGDDASDLVNKHGPFAATVALMAAISAINLIPLPPFAGFNLLEEIVKVVNGKGLGPAISLGLFRFHLVWWCVLAVTVVVRHLAA